jgi:hypothetical protein
MSSSRTLSRDAWLAVVLGSALTQAAALFGILISMIAWTALLAGAPRGFVVGPVACALLAIWPMLGRVQSLRILKQGHRVTGRWSRVERSPVLAQRPRGGGDRVVKATWTYQDASGRDYEGQERMREPAAPEPNAEAKLLLLPAGDGRVLRPAALHRDLQIGDRTVTTERATWSLALLPAIFVIVNLLGMAW